MVRGPPPMYKAICGPKNEKGKPLKQGPIDGDEGAGLHRGDRASSLSGFLNMPYMCSRRRRWGASYRVID